MVAVIDRVLPRDWDGRRLLRFLTGLALIALSFAVRVDDSASAAEAASAHRPAGVHEVATLETVAPAGSDVAAVDTPSSPTALLPQAVLPALPAVYHAPRVSRRATHPAAVDLAVAGPRAPPRR